MPEGFVEARPRNGDTPLDERKWDEITDLAETDYEDSVSRVEVVEPGWFVNPIFGSKILSQGQVLAFYAWQQWFKFLNIDEWAINRIEAALEMIHILILRGGHQLLLENLVGPVKMICENFVEEMPVRWVNDRPVLEREVFRPEMLIFGYSETLRSREFRLVKMLKKWLRMRTRQNMRVNLRDLARAISLVPIEVSDHHKHTCRKIICEIKRLIFIQYIGDEDKILENDQIRLIHIYRGHEAQDFVRFNYKTQKNGRTEEVEEHQIRGGCDMVRRRMLKVIPQRAYLNVKRMWDWGTVKKEVELLNGRNDPNANKRAWDLVMTMNVGFDQMRRDIEENFPQVHVHEVTGQIVDDYSDTTLSGASSNQSGQTGSEDSDEQSVDNEAGMYRGEYTLSSDPSAESVDIPSIEDLMQPE